MVQITGELLSALAGRVLKNLEFIDATAPPWDPESPEANEPPYADTQLLISLLAILIFPHERTPEALGELLDGFEGEIDDIIRIQYSAEPDGRVRLTTDDGATEIIDARSVKDLPRLLRNSIAHFNIKPLNVNGRFGGIRVWNRKKGTKGKINFVADLDFAAFRPLARHILRSLSEPEKLKLLDPPDPLPELAKQARADQKQQAEKRAKRDKTPRGRR